jgi:hypothetical protein
MGRRDGCDREDSRRGRPDGCNREASRKGRGRGAGTLRTGRRGRSGDLGKEPAERSVLIEFASRSRQPTRADESLFPTPFCPAASAPRQPRELRARLPGAGEVALLYVNTVIRRIRVGDRHEHGHRALGMPPRCLGTSPPRANRPLPPRRAAPGDLPGAGVRRRRRWARGTRLR